MAETLGSLCDKLTIVKLKEFHTEDPARLSSLQTQKIQLIEEIDTFIADALSGKIAPEKIEFSSNKVYKQAGNEIREISGSFGDVISELANVNCKLWHEQEKVYEFETVPAEQKNQVVKNLAILNLERTKCMDEINKLLKRAIINE